MTLNFVTDKVFKSHIKIYRALSLWEAVKGELTPFAKLHPLMFSGRQLSSSPRWYTWTGAGIEEKDAKSSGLRKGHDLHL